MPRKAAKLLKSDLDRLRALAEGKARPRRGEKRDRWTLADGASPGLYAQARRGRVRFFYRFRSPTTGERRRVDVGVYGDLTVEQARGEAAELRKLVAARVDPLEARVAEKRDATTVKDVVEGYLADLDARAESGTAKRGKPGGARAARGLLARHVEPAVGRVQVRKLTADRVRAIYDGLTAAGKGPTANRMLSAFSAALAWGERAGLVPPGGNVVRLVARTTAEKGRRRALTSPELEALGAALRAAEAAGAVHKSAALAVRLLALTGMRRSEVLGLDWDHVDLDRGLVFLDDSKTGRQTRVLGAAAVALLRAARPAGASPGDFVCPGARPGAAFVGIDKVRLKLWRAAGIAETPEGRADLHSLRHSFASIGADVQSGRFVGMIASLLGHGAQPSGITERYLHRNLEAQRPAADAIAAEVARLLGLGEPGRVVAFPKGAAR